MRIISGIAKGLSLSAPPGKKQTIRPTSDRSREALFSIIGSTVENSSILDLFAGTGALGLEALSRGGKKCLFVDSGNLSLSLLKRNVVVLQKQFTQSQIETPIITVHRHDLRKGLSFIENLNLPYPPVFDLIFIDPPYDKGLALTTLNLIDSTNYYSENAIIVAEDRAKNSLPETFNSFSLTDKRKYGDTGFWIYRPNL